MVTSGVIHITEKALANANASFLLVRLEGIEPPTCSLGNCRSILLSYRRMYILL